MDCWRGPPSPLTPASNCQNRNAPGPLIGVTASVVHIRAWFLQKPSRCWHAQPHVHGRWPFNSNLPCRTGESAGLLTRPPRRCLSDPSLQAQALGSPLACVGFRMGCYCFFWPATRQIQPVPPRSPFSFTGPPAEPKPTPTPPMICIPLLPADSCGVIRLRLSASVLA